MKKRVVITGMDIVSSIGVGLPAFWEAALEGKSGIDRITRYDPIPYPTQIGGEIKALPVENFPGLINPKRHTQAAQYALYCAHHAIERSGLTLEERAAAGTFLGTSLGGTPELESCYKTFFTESWKKIPALSVIRGMPNSVANHLAIAFGLQGPNSTFSNACVSSAEAIGQGYQQISAGRLAVALCGGTESLLWESLMAAWCKLRVMSTQNEIPALASRPFDLHRDGLVMADGAAMLVLEDYDHAKARGATMIAEITGYGASCDARHLTAPESQGQQRAIHLALEDARLSVNDVHYISAHGTGTLLNDKTETESIKAVFGKHAYDIPITAQKAMTGHAIGAAGAMEVVATALCLQENTLLPTINLTTPDPACDLDYIPQTRRSKNIDIAVSNHFAFGGANAVLVLQKMHVNGLKPK